MGKKKGVLALAVGAVVGFVAGILTAPKSGKETRQDIKNVSKKLLKDAEKHIKEAQKGLNKQLKGLEKKGLEFKGKAMQEVDLLKKRAGIVQEHLRLLMADLKSGEIDESMLNKTLKEAESTRKKIAKHIKKATKK